jgi:histone H3/H4
VQSKVREVIRQKEKRVSDEFIGALSDYVLHTIERAVQRCSANGRSTLRPEDI